MGGVVGKSGSESSGGGKGLEAKIVDAMKQRGKGKGTHIKSFNTILLKFPKIDHSLRTCFSTFHLLDEDSNGSIDLHELHKCFHHLSIPFSQDDISDFFNACDLNHDLSINFTEFIVLLSLLYLLQDHHPALHSKLKIGMPNLESTLETLVEAFLFLDSNNDGYVSKTEMVQAINDTASGEPSSSRIALRRFEEMDWDKNGTVNFKEFVFAFTHWVGIDDDEDDDEEQLQL